MRTAARPHQDGIQRTVRGKKGCWTCPKWVESMAKRGVMEGQKRAVASFVVRNGVNFI